MEFFTARVCPYCHRIHLAMLEKGIEADLTEIDFKNKPGRFLAVSPYGKVPAIVHQGQNIYESAVINEYLDEAFPDPPLLPQHPALRAKARIWINFCDDTFTSTLYAIIRNRDPEKHGALAGKLAEHFRFIERKGFGRLSDDGPYWFGSEVTLTDLAWYPFFERLPAWEHYRGVSLPDGCTRLARWLEAMSGRPSVQKIANAPEYYVESYEHYAGGRLAA